MGDFRGARMSVREALRDFRWLEYRPFLWIMVIEVLFLFFALNLGTAWGMAGAGWLLKTIGAGALHYPASYLVLTIAQSRLEWALFTLLGSFLIPLSLVRIEAPMAGFSPTGPDSVRRARRAYLPTFIAQILNIVLVILWQLLLQVGPSRWIHFFVGGIIGDTLTLGVGILIAFLISALFIYVPIRGVDSGGSIKNALLGGIQEGIRYLGPTLFIVLVFIWPTLIFLAPVQLRPALLVTRFRPELIAILLLIATVLNSFVNYLIYSAAARLHWLGKRREG